MVAAKTGAIDRIYWFAPITGMILGMLMYDVVRIGPGPRTPDA